ncbi:MAG: ABC transporter permease [Bacteroidota bacterium]|nr:ABC transporter permease [Bacteroidota bacterium]
MFDRDHWNEIFNTLKKNKWRTFFTAFGVFWGIFMLIIMVGSGAGLRNGVKSNLGDFATNSMFVWTQRTTMPYKGFNEGRRFYFDNEDTKALKNNFPQIKYLAPRLQGGSGGGRDNVVNGLKSGSFGMYGDDPIWNKIDPAEITVGRFLNNIDVEKRRKVVVIGSYVRKVMFDEDEDVIGKYLRIQGVYFQVIGVFKPAASNINFGGEKEKSVFMPYTAMQQVYNYGNMVHWYAITGEDGSSIADVEDDILEFLAKRHSVNPEDKEAFGFFNLGKEFEKISGLFTGINFLIWIVGIGTLFAGVIGISNIMLVIVKERTQEIGIQRAIGAPPSKIISQIISESIILTASAGYVGLLLGVGVIELLNMALVSQSGEGGGIFKNPEVDFNMALAALAILVVSGMLAGVIPALKTIKIKPIDALRAE